jgi:hypothetical protein
VQWLVDVGEQRHINQLLSVLSFECRIGWLCSFTHDARAHAIDERRSCNAEIIRGQIEARHGAVVGDLMTSHVAIAAAFVAAMTIAVRTLHGV